ncbi:class GN sortase [Shewanella marina]|uniref:class GN sortase n=1 Tax=Shewanella marina TaxID=487319 RepID=UPI000A7DA928|nr:class GN sortase [Shewanella marina]
MSDIALSSMLVKTHFVSTRLMRRKLAWLMITVILLVGAGLVVKGSYMQLKAQLAQFLIADSWQQSMLLQRPVKPWFYADTWPKAKLSFAQYGIEQYVLSGASGRNLAFGPAHLLSTHEFDASGPSLIAGHNDTHFSFLKQVAVGDEFELQNQQGQVLKYRVSQIDVIHQSEDYFLYENSAKLYLMTCYPFNAIAAGTELRYLVTAEIVV